MAAIKDLIQVNANNTLSFGNPELEEKTKIEDFLFEGDLYKVKTFKERTKLKKNGELLYESMPGTSVSDFVETDDSVSCTIDTINDTQITLGLLENTEYQVFIDGASHGSVKTNLSGKLLVSLSHDSNKAINLEVKK